MPYSRRELGDLAASLDTRWPRLPPDDAMRWTRRFLEGRSPYSRVRGHAIRLQLDAVIAVALHLGLRRTEIFQLHGDWCHYDNFGVVVWKSGVPWDGACREVPHTDGSRDAMRAWLDFRDLLAVDHDSPWVATWSTDTLGQPMTRDVFNTLLRTYIGRGWTLKRLRDTCAVAWLRAGLPIEMARQLLGLSSLEDVLPYASLARGDLDGHMRRAARSFARDVRLAA